MKRLFWTLVFGCSLLAVSAQQVNTLYFLENSPHRHYLNPALAPLSKMYLSLPAIGYTSLSVGNNSLALSDFIYKQDGKTVTFLHPEYGDTHAFIKGLKKSVTGEIDAQITLLSFGGRTKKDGYWHVTLNERIEGGVSLPKDLFTFALDGGMKDLNGVNHFNLKQLGLNVSVYTELGIGYMHPINEQWAVGGKIKFLYGHAYANMTNQAFDLNASSEEWNLQGNGYAMIAAPINCYPASIMMEDIQNTQWGLLQDENGNMDIMGMVKPQGLGAALDLGMTYKPHEKIQISAAVTDLGFISWNKGMRYNYNIDGTYTGVGELKYSDYYNTGTQQFETKRLTDTITTHLQGIYQNAIQPDGNATQGFTRMISPRLNVGVDANFWDNRIGLGIYSQTKFVNTRIYEEVTIGAAFRPCHWFQIAASYSFLNGKGSNIGAALGIVTYEGIGLTLAADYIPCSYADYTAGTTTLPLPYNTKGINLTFGVNIVIGHKQDKDRDGVRDKDDLCPNTPRGIIVDDHGCPLDTDGDGVPDYLDKCPETPAAAYNYIDSTGCPIDTDLDGVFDYLDECPNTPDAAFGYTDAKGCPMDSDGDDVPDYLDQCPGTPAEAYGLVDADGCPIDTDGDGVADYLDKCPNTPAEARGYIDANGCPADTDGDGVVDYLDKCPNTPAEARGLVDEDGCLLDTDGDGVEDYLDKCPNTPAEAHGYIDAHGCELDTDGDGMVDWKDQCPTIAGDVENNGCPVVKREVRTLLQKAMKGIQFDTGTDHIKKSSYTMLNQIAEIFKENPIYKVEIQGHTDNVGKPSINFRLSEERANAVRDYLIDQGVPAQQLTAKGYGDTMPIADNKTSKGRAQNRRVEFSISFEEVTYEEVIHTSDSTYVVEVKQDSIQPATVDTAPIAQ